VNDRLTSDGIRRDRLPKTSRAKYIVPADRCSHQYHTDRVQRILTS
jgi:hypothetical protein